MTCEVRLAVASDIGATGTILQDWIEATPWMPVLHTRGETMAFCAGLIAGEAMIVAEEQGKVIGFLAQGGQTIVALYLQADARGRGVGATLLNAAQRSGETLDLWCFQMNRGGQRFYEREGFTTIKTTNGEDNAEGLADILFRRTRPQEDIT
ncbi:GNAT family N-acetyltransferase [Shimia sediminis]|uniref:GNAT family N-acetyltransferase n=1 Tax=Shimia sediminis TaxID=2497945 RepID=UPI000F8F0146|nr:GNAT family N-acetyltransferase [Shimia sediminis]